MDSDNGIAKRFYSISAYMICLGLVCIGCVQLQLGCAIGRLNQVSDEQPEIVTTSKTSPEVPQTNAKIRRLTNIGNPTIGPADPAELGQIIGAVYDRKIQKLFIIGDGQHVEASPSLQQIAMVLEPGEGAAYISIDPLADQPDAPVMQVVTSEAVKDTDFGWVMYEADRMLKSYSLGKDSLTHRPLDLQLAGYRNSLQLAYAQSSQQTENPKRQRFWLAPPEQSIAQVSPHGIFLVNDPMGIDTQSMKLVGGKLVPEPGRRDSRAEQFAAFVSKHYMALSEDDLIFMQLEQLHRLLLIAAWVHHYRIPVSLEWVARHAKTHFPLPRLTPELKVGVTAQHRTANFYSERTLHLSGGVTFVDFNPELQAQPLPAWLAVPSEIAVKVDPGQAVRFRYDDRLLVAYAVPIVGTVPPQSLADLFDIPLPDGGTLRLATRLVQPSDLGGHSGADRILALPALRVYKRLRTFGIRGQPDTQVQVRHYVLYAADGRLLGSFEKHDIDQERKLVRVRPHDPRSQLALYPRPDGQVNVLNRADGTIWGFHVTLPTLLAERRGPHLIRYHYTASGLVERITLGEGDDEDVLVEMQLGNNDHRLLAATRMADGKTYWINPPRNEAKSLQLVAHTELGQARQVWLSKPHAEWRTPESKIGLEYLNRHAHTLQALADMPSSRPHLIADGGLTILFFVNKVYYLPASIETPLRLLDLVRQTLPGETTLLAMAREKDGRLAVLYRVNGNYELDLIDHSRPTESFKGNEALRRYDQLESDDVARASDDQLQFVKLSQMGDQVTIQLGNTELRIPVQGFQQWMEAPHASYPELDQLFRLPADSGLNTAVVVHRPASDRYLSDAHPSRREIVVDPQRFATFLRLRYPERRVFLDDTTGVSRKNFKKLSNITITRPDQIVSVLVENFSGVESVKHGLKLLDEAGVKPLPDSESLGIEPTLNPDEESGRNVLLITGHNDQELTAYLRHIGRLGVLRERVILLVTCFADANADIYQELVQRYGAIAVLHHGDPISPFVLEPVLAELAQMLKQPTPSGFLPEQLVQQAAARASIKINSKQKLHELDKFFNSVLQISELHESTTPLTNRIFARRTGMRLRAWS